MHEPLVLGLTAVLVLEIAAQWLAWRLRLPAILLLLLVGILAGPVTGLLDPTALLGELLGAMVSLAVAVILFEGGLNLRWAEVRAVGRVVRNLITVGALITWLLGAGAAYLLVGLDVPLAILLGGILVVSGPTVVGPLLRHVRPIGPVGPILKWEGVLIDPIGALLAVMIFETLLARGGEAATVHIVVGVLKTVVLGGGLGVLGAGVLIRLFQRYWVPDYLHQVMSLTLALGVFATANWLQAEAGLLAVTVMGITLANQQIAPPQAYPRL